MGLLERHAEKGKSKIRLQGLDGLQKGQMQPHVRKHIEAGSTVYTDAHFSYQGLSRDFAHNVIDHAEAYVDGQIHTNGCENFWSLLKRAIKGTYVSIEPFHLFRYLDEQSFRFNERHDDDGGRFESAIKGVVGRRVTYKALIGALEPETC
jgi:transposase-like protein